MRAEQADPPRELQPGLLSAQGLTTASITAGYSPSSTAKDATCPANTPDTSAKLCQGSRPSRDCTGQAEGCFASSQALLSSRAFGFMAKPATGISRHHTAASPRSKGTRHIPAPIRRSHSAGLCPCKATGKSSSWDAAQKKQTLTSAKRSRLPRGKVMFPAWKAASPCGALAGSEDRGCRLVPSEVTPHPRHSDP